MTITNDLAKAREYTLPTNTTDKRFSTGIREILVPVDFTVVSRKAIGDAISKKRLTPAIRRANDDVPSTKTGQRRMVFLQDYPIGMDTRTPVDDGYKLPFKFTGTINKVTYHIGPEQLTAAEQSIKSRRRRGRSTRLSVAAVKEI